jgi:hypothetical protein
VEWDDDQEEDEFVVPPAAADGFDAPVDNTERLLPSLAFWLCLAFSAAILAVVFLSPRLRTYRDLRRQYDGLERDLVAAEGNVDNLNRIVDALKHDPDFAAELARADFSVGGSEERIAVAPALRLNGVSKPAQPVTPEAAHPFPQSALDTPLLDSFADNRPVRLSLLGAASLLVLVAFTLLCEKTPGGEPVESIPWGQRCRSWLADRYSRARS